MSNPNDFIDSDFEPQNFTSSAAGFDFSGAPTDELAEGSSKYTLVNISVDLTGSVHGFEDALRAMVITALGACKKSPDADQLLVRLSGFNTSIGANYEFFGFTLLSKIDLANIPQFSTAGSTPLNDATFANVDSSLTFGKGLKQKFYTVNGLSIIISDGEDNSSRYAPDAIKKRLASAKQQEELESLLTILVGVNTAQCSSELAQFKTDAGLDEYIDINDATEENLAALANWISKSISSQSQACGTGGASQLVAVDFN